VERVKEVRSEEEILVEYLRRAYHAVDGLWFMMVEQESGFDRALELDRRVWEVLAKIEARKARELMNCAGNSPEELARCFGLKLKADGQEFEADASDEGVRFALRGCAWLDLLRKSGREHLAVRIGQAICMTEGRTWCAEFGGEYEFEIPVMGCAGLRPSEGFGPQAGPGGSEGFGLQAHSDRCHMLFARKG